MKIRIELEPTRWDSLSMRDRAKYIHQSILNHYANGGSLTDISINDIRHEFDEGGAKNKFQYRADWYAKHPEVIEYINLVADIYDINPVLLADRIAHEGAIDNYITWLKDFERRSKERDYYRNQGMSEQLIDDILFDTRGKFMPAFLDVDLNENESPDGLDYHVFPWLELGDCVKMDPFVSFGLDTVGDRIMNGSVKLRNGEVWDSGEATNEKDTTVHPAFAATTRDAIGIQAATLKAMRDAALKDHPDADDDTLDRMAMIYYNRGEGGARSYLRNHPNNFGYNFNPGIVNLFLRLPILPLDLSNIKTVLLDILENPNYLDNIFNPHSNGGNLIHKYDGKSESTLLMYTKELAYDNWKSAFMNYGKDDDRTVGWKNYYDKLNNTPLDGGDLPEITITPTSAYNNRKQYYKDLGFLDTEASIKAKYDTGDSDVNSYERPILDKVGNYLKSAGEGVLLGASFANPIIGGLGLIGVGAYETFRGHPTQGATRAALSVLPGAHTLLSKISPTLGEAATAGIAGAFAGLAADDIYNNGLTPENATNLGLSLLPFSSKIKLSPTEKSSTPKASASETPILKDSLGSDFDVDTLGLEKQLFKAGKHNNNIYSVSTKLTPEKINSIKQQLKEGKSLQEISDLTDEDCLMLFGQNKATLSSWLDLVYPNPKDRYYGATMTLFSHYLTGLNNLTNVYNAPKVNLILADYQSAVRNGRELEYLESLTQDLKNAIQEIQQAYNLVNGGLWNNGEIIDNWYYNRVKDYFNQQDPNYGSVRADDFMSLLANNILDAKLSVGLEGYGTVVSGDGMTVSNARGVYDPLTHTASVLTQNPGTTFHELIHASDKGRPLLDNKNYKMRTKASLSSEDLKYYGMEVELRERVLETLEDMANQGYDVNDPEHIKESWEEYSDRPIDELPKGAQDLIECYEEEDIPRALIGFKTVLPWLFAYPIVSSKKDSDNKM